MPDGNSRSALSPSIVFAPAASKCRRQLQSNAMDERVGMTMHQLPWRGLQRRIVLAVPTIMMALPHLSSSELIGALPRRLAERHAARFALSGPAAI